MAEPGVARFTVAIDGPAAAGKGTIARGVAVHFGFAHLDTGLIYRAVGRKVLGGMDPVEAAGSLLPDDLGRDDLRTPEVAQAASGVAANAKVREMLVEFQRDIAHQRGGAVLDGRDIGTVICPDAEVKLFVTATDAVRAQRRLEELTAMGNEISLAHVREDLRVRDERDSERDIAPTRRAADAVLLDTSEMTIEEAVRVAIDVVAAKLGTPKPG
ncbi:MAG: (d)CMP kinase [Paracoccaceae bacterium]